MPKICPFLWFNDQAEEAMRHYISIFKNSRVISVQRHGNGESATPGPVFMAVFELDGQTFMALNGGPAHTFTEGISMFVDCDDQAEVDDLWEKLSAGGEEGRCGWLKDKFGLSWQIVPKALGELLGGDDAEGASRAMQAMLTMRKIDVQALRAAYAGQPA